MSVKVNTFANISINYILKLYGRKNRPFSHVHKGIPLQTQGRHRDKQEQHTRREDQREYMPVHSLPLLASGWLLVLPSGKSEKRIERRALPAVFSAVCLSPSARGKSVRANIIYMAARIFHKFRSPFLYWPIVKESLFPVCAYI